jgi:hypothetical protein
MILTIIFGWTAGFIDVQGAFLCGNFKDGEEIYREVPDIFEMVYPNNVLLLLLQTIRGLRQAARAFWHELRSALSDMKYDKSMTDPYLLLNYSHSRTPVARPYGRTDKSKRPESHPTKDRARACLRCRKTEPNYYYCPISLVVS